MDTILQNRAIVNLPAAELEDELSAFLEPILLHLPEKRLREVGKLAVKGVIGGQSSVVTQMARGVRQEKTAIWPMAKRLYRKTPVSQSRPEMWVITRALPLARKRALCYH